MSQPLEEKQEATAEDEEQGKEQEKEPAEEKEEEEEEDEGEKGRRQDSCTAERILIKSHHAIMRKRLRDGGNAAAVWAENVKDEEKLVQYASAMRKLGGTWQGKEESEAPERVEWLLREIQAYYRGDGDTGEGDRKKRKLSRTVQVPGVIAWRLKDARRKHFQTHNEHMPEDVERTVSEELIQQYRAPPQVPLDVLDVGSCYNPMGAAVEEGKRGEILKLDVLPVDLCPAPGSNVFKCDFTTISVAPDTASGLRADVDDATRTVTALRSGSFHVVVFCMLLSYMPCPRLRFSCVENAFRALRPDGLLLIITPRTTGRKDLVWLNTWHAALKALGFQRIKQQIRQKIICIAYRKALYDTTPPAVPEHLAQIPIGADSNTD